MALEDDVKYCDVCDSPQSDTNEVYTIIGGDEARTQDVVGHVCEECWTFFTEGSE